MTIRTYIHNSCRLSHNMDSFTSINCDAMLFSLAFTGLRKRQASTPTKLCINFFCRSHTCSTLYGFVHHRQNCENQHSYEHCFSTRFFSCYLEYQLAGTVTSCHCRGHTNSASSNTTKSEFNHTQSHPIASYLSEQRTTHYIYFAMVYS